MATWRPHDAGVECPGRAKRRQPEPRLVAEYAALGHANKFIAYELGLSVSSVATYLKRAMTKLGIATRMELIEYFGQRGRINV